MFYTGIGSRETPEHVLKQMTEIAKLLEKQGYTLRSGAASGADSAFAKGVEFGNLVEYIPWNGFSNKNHNGTSVISLSFVEEKMVDKALILAKYYVNHWSHCSLGARKLHTRNVFQIIGHEESSPLSEFVICYCPVEKGKLIGGTATAVKIALSKKIPVYNLFKDNIYDSIIDGIIKHQEQTIF